MKQKFKLLMNMEESNLEFENKVKFKNKRILRNTFIRFFIVLFLFITLAIYMFTPISSISNLILDGNIYFNNEDVYSILNYSSPEKTSLYSVDKEKSEELLDNFPLISNSKIDISPFEMKISLNEEAPSSKYQNVIYSSEGNILDDNILNNPLLTSYFEKSLVNTAEFLTEPIKNNNLKHYLKIVCLINSQNKSIEFIEENEENIFIYYINRNSNYFRVNLKYNSDFSDEYYAKNLILDENLENCLNEKVKSLSLQKKVYGEKEISYYPLRFEFKDNKIIIAGDIENE